MTRKRTITGWFTVTALVLVALPGLVQAACDTSVGKFVSITGSVDVQSTGGSAWATAKLETRLCEGDTIRVGERSRAAVSLINNAVLRIDQNTAMRLIDITPQDEEQSILDVFTGAFQSFSRKPKFLRVNTPYLNGSVEGTEFVFRVEDEEATITVLEGVVLASNNQGELRVEPGESAQAAKGQAPQKRVVVKPRDLVQWGLYYPPVMSVATPGDVSPAIQNAATLLSLGRVDEARAEIDAALQKDAKSGAAYALRAVIAVALNDNETALSDARRAVELSPGSASAKIALSYAQQANLELAAARDTLLQAVDQEPENALAWARLAELHLMLGNRREASAAAERAVALEPGLSRTQNVLGFAALAEIRAAQAQVAFEQAIALDSDDPMPRLGLGLAKIRQGQLEEGRADLEAAVALDSNNALLRAYLGKAYFEEKRGPLDARQFDVAKDLDPLDPTAYFYNAIRLQTENQPVDALHELTSSIERNDNRAVYRGGLLLDQDRAARGTSQARVYSDLGFTQSGLGESRRSLMLSPSDASAHRFLSDSYRSERRREISRVSELLQAQMLQDINSNPVQPSVSETNLNAVASGGPSGVGLNEYTQLFERNGASVNATGFAGSNDTLGGEAVVSGIYDRLSLSAGAYHYETDGWRDNNDLNQDIYNIFAQVAITPELNVQAEFRHRESEEGDLAFNFDPDDYSDNKNIDRDQDTWRLGLRYSPTEATTLLVSYINNDRDEELSQTEALDPFTTAANDTKVNDDGDQFEAQYILEQERYNLVAGLAYSEIDTRTDSSILITNVFLPFPLLDVTETTKGDTEHKRGYAYSNIELMDDVVATLGLSYDDYDEGPLEESDFYPKAGIQWQVNDGFKVRAAAFQTRKAPLVANRTVEPTQIAGFNQFFDDINATESTRYGVGFDWMPIANLTVGGEATWRDLEEPIFRPVEQDAIFEDRDEELHRAYLYWTPDSQWAVTAELVYDLYEAEDGIATEFDNLPKKVETVSVPLGVKYFHPTGFYAGLGGTYVDQKVRRSATATQADGSDDFFLVDAAVGYRLPKRAGVISLQVKNLFDDEFNYQDDSYREFRDEPSTGPYFPERTIMGTLTVNF
jgi:Tfp pilus assembly protein PilF